jgi:hypothetical protein
MNAKKIIERAGQLEKNRGAMLTLWQDIADNFYPQRADFTRMRHLGEEFASDLHSSYPIIVHRDLSNAFASMLRPRAKEWFSIEVEGMDAVSKAGKEWLEWACKRQRSAMYDRRANMIRATSEGDADFAAFGQCAITRDINWNSASPHLLYRSWHLRDVVWAEQDDGSIGEHYFKWKPTIRQLWQKFGEARLSPKLAKNRVKNDLDTVDCRMFVVTTDVSEGTNGEAAGYPWCVGYVDCANQHMIMEYGQWTSGCILPRWQTVSGSQYAYSPAAVAGLPDARLLQAMSLTLLEAGEMSVRPPMIATQDAIRGDVALYAGGITWADVEYDERKGDVLRPITQDRRGLPTAFDQREGQMAMLAEAFYINKLTLPPPQSDMTAFEVGQRVEEYVRAALPLFEPMEYEYNGQLCEDAFDAMLRAGAFGSPYDMPQELRGRDVYFRFTSPLHDAIERKEASTFMESAELIRIALEMDPNALAAYDTGSALRSALEGVGVEAKHLRSEDEVQRILAANARQAQLEEQAQLAKTAGGAAREFAAAEKNMAAA